MGGNGAGASLQGSEETAGAFGMGFQFSNALSLLFTFLLYTLPILGTWITEAKIVRHKTICIGIAIYGVAYAFTISNALPSALQAGSGIGPFMVAYFC